MMSKETYDKLYDHVITSLQRHELQWALLLIKQECREHQQMSPVSEAETIENDYCHMLDYLRDGGDDPQRKVLLDQFYERTWTLLDRIEYDRGVPPYRDILLFDFNVLADLLHAAPNDDVELSKVFEYTAIAPTLSDVEQKQLINLLTDESLPQYVRATLMGATMLRLTQQFDARLVEALYPFTFDDQPLYIQTEAWVSLVFVALIFPDRIAHHPRLREQYALLCEENPGKLREIQLTLLQCREATGFESRMKRLTDEDEETMKEQIQDFLRSVQEGIDTGITMFSHLKKLPFFNNPNMRHHWFEPFDLDQPDVKEGLEKSPESRTWLQILQQSVAQTNTDKYAAMISMTAISSNLISALGSKLKEAGIREADIRPISPIWVLRNVLHDFYRYCTMHDDGRQLRYSPFDQLSLYRNPWLCAAFTDQEMLQTLADYLYERQRYADAADIYDLLVERNPKHEYLKHEAMALREIGRYGQAIELMTRSLRLYPTDNKSAYRILADCHSLASHHQQEREVLDRALSLYPSEKCFLWRKGRCLIDLGQAREALKPLYQLDLQEEHQPAVDRQLARALLCLGELDKAVEHVRQLSEAPTPRADDLALAGHIALRMGDYARAVNLYSEARKSDEQIKLFDPAFLSLSGIADTDATLMQEILERN